LKKLFCKKQFSLRCHIFIEVWTMTGMRVWPTFLLLFLFAQPTKWPKDMVRNIPKRYRKDWRLFCNVCNHFIWSVNDKLNKSIHEGDEHDFESRVGFRLDSKGKKHNLKQKSIDIRRSEIKITEVMDEDICDSIKVDAVLYNKKSKKKEGVRMLLKNQQYNKTKDLGFSKKRKYVGKANLYCAEVYQRYYDEVIAAFTSENIGGRDSFCNDHIDSRCPFITELPKITIKPPGKTTKNNASKEIFNQTVSGEQNQEDHNETNASGNFSNKTEVVGEKQSREENEEKRQPLEETAPEKGEQSEPIQNVERSSEKDIKPEEPEKHNEL